MDFHSTSSLGLRYFDVDEISCSMVVTWKIIRRDTLFPNMVMLIYFYLKWLLILMEIFQPKERRIYLGSSTIAILAVLLGTLGILLICIATGCYVWNRRMSKSIEQSSEIRLGQREIERTYEQLQRQPSVETDRNVDDNYTIRTKK
ncbi:hypothetical protein MAR_032215 [Mya arenaria]|uniref:Transmembrane protein n=1 Tax=Mya arenaria TaxID=6604 RepID=A0ABY7FED2_MYAAR|nr:hypothetical protein MAR_032215 [Mya arenaria]